MPRQLRGSTASERTRERLIEAAGEMFAELGFHHTTVREICNRAGANIAAVNYHFGDKTRLYTEVVRQSMRAAKLEAVRAAFDQNAPPAEILRAVIKTRLESLRGLDLGDWHFRIFAHELAKPTPPHKTPPRHECRSERSHSTSLPTDVQIDRSHRGITAGPSKNTSVRAQHYWSNTVLCVCCAGDQSSGSGSKNDAVTS